MECNKIFKLHCTKFFQLFIIPSLCIILTLTSLFNTNNPMLLSNTSSLLFTQILQSIFLQPLLSLILHNTLSWCPLPNTVTTQSHCLHLWITCCRRHCWSPWPVVCPCRPLGGSSAGMLCGYQAVTSAWRTPGTPLLLTHLSHQVKEIT